MADPFALVYYCICSVYHTSSTHIHTAGISPWKIGMLAANLYLGDIMWKRIEVPSYQEGWMIDRPHIERAFQLMVVFSKIRTTYTYVHHMNVLYVVLAITHIDCMHVHITG